jgi:1-acyl-sn-glycerol-3-phosphate acyltransferase
MTTAVAVLASERELFYPFLRLVARFWLWFLFKRVHVRHLERVPPTGPVMLCINHPNNLIDSLLVGAVVPRPVHFLATATLFRRPLLRWVLSRAGVIPIHRTHDEPPASASNAEAFAACHAAFDQGGVIAVYPEGTTHAEARVQRIKTGAARIALGYEAQRPETLSVIPVGLSFEARKSFTARVLVAFGEPVALTAYGRAYRVDPVKAVEELTAAIQWAMEAQVVHVDRIETAAVVRAVEELYRSHLVRELRAERGLAEEEVDLFRISRSIVEAVAHFKQRDPRRVERIWRRIQAYRALLARYQVTDDAVQARSGRRTIRRRVLSAGEAVAVFPLFAYGAVVNALPYFVPRWLARRRARKETDYATTRLLASIVAVPLFWGLEIWLVVRLAGVLGGALFALSLPVSGLVAYHYLRGIDALRHGLRLGLLALTRGAVAGDLLAERRQIIAELDRAREGYLAATRGSSF